MIKNPTLNKKPIQVNRALLSVFDKEGIVELAQLLVTKNIEILSTGGTAKTLRENNIPVVDVSDYTNFPEIMDGRVKTINPLVCLLYTSPSPRDLSTSRMPSSA